MVLEPVEETRADPESGVVGMKYIVVIDQFCKILKALNKHLQEVARTQESSVNDQENLGLCNLILGIHVVWHCELIDQIFDSGPCG